MKSFSFNRFGKTLRWLMSVNRLTLLGLFGGTAVGMFLIEMGMYGMQFDSTPDNYLRHISFFAVFCMAILALLCISSAFTGFTQIGSKQQRATFLMLPAMNLEKFLAVVLLVTIVYMTVAVVGLVVGDSLRMGVMATLNQFHSMADTYMPDGEGIRHTYWWSSAIPRVCSHLNPAIPFDGDTFIYGERNDRMIVEVCSLGYTLMRYALLFAFLAWIHSLFMLGGTQLRKYAFVLSGLVFMLAMWLLGQIIQTFGLDMYDHVPYYAINQDGYSYIEHNVHTLRPMAYVVLALLTLLNAFNYWASFRIFKHFEIVTNKWTNYDILKR